MIYYRQSPQQSQHPQQPSYIPYPVYRTISQQQYQNKHIETFSDRLKPPWQLLY